MGAIVTILELDLLLKVEVGMYLPYLLLLKMRTGCLYVASRKIETS